MFSAVPFEHFVDGDRAVVYSPFSGETHQLSAAAWLVLEKLRLGPFSEQEITATVSGALDPLESSSAVPLAKSVLNELLRLRLVERHAEPTSS